MIKMLSKNGNPGLNILSFNVDIELCGWLVSLYQISCGNGTIRQYHDHDWITLTQCYGVVYELYSTESHSPITPVSGKFTSFFVVVGLGSLLCYRLFKLVCRLNIPSFFKSCDNRGDTSPPVNTSATIRSTHEFRSHYFGPVTKCSDEKPDVVGKKIDGSSGDSDWSPHIISHPKRRYTKRLHREWLFSKIRKYVSCDRFSAKNIQEESCDSTDSSPSPVVLSLRREGSLDSMCSDLSLDLSAFVETESSTVARLDQLQDEIELLKSNCLSMDEEFETIKTNRNMPGLSSLIESSQENADVQVKESAKACFKGLYSLTTINRSMSFDLSPGTSTDDDSPIHLSPVQIQIEEGSFSSLEWDSQDANLNMLSPCERMETSATSLNSPITNSNSFLPMDQSWSTDNFEQLLNDSDQIEPSRNKCNDSPSRFGTSLNMNKITRNIIGPILPLPEFISSNLYSVLGSVSKAYDSIIHKLGLKHVRPVHYDNYSGIRAPIYQVLSMGLPIPSGQSTINQLTEALHTCAPWLSSWYFACQLPYAHNFLRGMQVCLTTLDNVVLMLESSSNKPDLLMTMMNTDPTLDIHLMEAIKLHMVAHLLSVHSNIDEENMYSTDLSKLFSQEEESYSPPDYMNNYIQLLGNTAGLKKVEMNLLGQTLSITLKIMKPSAYGTHEFISYHPESIVSNWPIITLLSEDGRNYSILLD